MDLLWPKFGIGTRVKIRDCMLFPNAHPIRKKIGEVFTIKRVDPFGKTFCYGLEIPGHELSEGLAWFLDNDLELAVDFSDNLFDSHKPKCMHPKGEVIVNTAGGVKFRYCRSCKEDLGTII